MVGAERQGVHAFNQGQSAVPPALGRCAFYRIDDRTGEASSALTQFSFLKPYQLSFDSQTFLWVADKSALQKLGLGSGDVLPPGFATALTPPILGVAAN